MKKFNLSDWALDHASMVWYFMIVFGLLGFFSYLSLGREEDPSFTIKTMTISAQWPGASVEETTLQVTERIERKLEELESLDYTRSITTPGQTLVFVNLKDTTKARDVPSIWLTVRNMIGDIQGQFPSGVVGPSFNDRFGDVFGNIYAFTADGLTQRQLRDYVETARREILTVPNVGKVDIVGAQDEVIYLEFSTRQLAALGINQNEVIATLQAQNAIAPSGVVQAEGERVSVRVNGQFSSEDSLRAVNLQVNNRFFRLTDIATISRGYTDPPSALFRYNGQSAIGLAIGMKQGANLLEFGDHVEEKISQVEAELPVGVGVHLVSDQPLIVEEAVSGFTRGLAEAVVIVLLVSFVSLGVRAGLVVALSIPLTLAITFVVMSYFGISLQRISLGALIIALGLLVDDAMIAVEMMVARLEAGDSLRKAATYVYTSTAFPMLTGTLVTVASFIPVGLNNSAAGEFTFTLFVVIAVSLVVSWIVAVVFAPLLGVTILPKTMKQHHDEKGRVARVFSRVLAWCMRWKWTTIGLTVVVFALSLFGMTHVQQQFFPSSDRLELIVDWSLPQNASITDTNAQMAKFEQDKLARQSRCRALVHLCGAGRGPLRSFLRCAAAGYLVRPDDHRHQEPGGPRQAARRPAEISEGNLRRHGCLCEAARHRSAGRPSRAIPGERSGYRQGARASAGIRQRSWPQSAAGRCGLRLERAGARDQGRRPAGQGPPAGRYLAGYRLCAQRHRRRNDRDAGA